jgi:type IV secretory pathway TrbD component
MTRHHAHTGDRLVMVLGAAVVLVFGVAAWCVALFGVV